MILTLLYLLRYHLQAQQAVCCPEEAERGGRDWATKQNCRAAPNCSSDLVFFRFPPDTARCQKWVENCRRADSEDKIPNQRNKHYRLCAKHFETSVICRTN